MIGNLWSVGITIEELAPGEYAASLDFQDDGFAEARSISGKLCVRYTTRDLDRDLPILAADAERLGIEWRVGPAVYCESDGELPGGDRPDLRRLANDQARKLGWKPVYKHDLQKERKEHV